MIPSVWPTPGNPNTRLSVFRIEIDRPENAAPTINGHVHEAVELGNSTFRTYRPEFTLASDLVTLASDSDKELAQAAVRCGNDLALIMWKLYERLEEKIDAVKAKADSIGE